MIRGLFDFAGSLLRGLDPEQAHEITLKSLEGGLHPFQTRPDDPRLAQQLWGLNFANPIGVAPGFDKDARVPDAILKMGFGYAEIGTVTPRPQSGNPRPRVFRLRKDKAIINRLGFNSEGHGAALRRLRERRRVGIVGVNIGANKETADLAGDYVSGIETFIDVADYFTVNISSPNTPGLRDLQTPELLEALLARVMQARSRLTGKGHVWRPVLVKLAPDIHPEDLPAVVETLIANQADGIIVSNTTVSRPDLKDQTLAAEAGGLSGAPLFDISTRMLARVYLLTGGKVPLIGVGGIDSAERAVQKVTAGACLLQLYTGLVYQGPRLVEHIKKGLSERLQRENLSSLSALVGTHAGEWSEETKFGDR